MMKKQANKINRNPKQSMRDRQRGNTLVPVVIGLGIAAVATVSFLDQGEGLLADNNRVIATNEVSSILKDYNAIRSTGTAAAGVTAVMVPGLTAANIYGIAANGWAQANAVFSYTTDSAQTCQQLLAAFTGADRVTAPPAPANAAGNTTNCSDVAAAAPNGTAAENDILNLLLN